MSFSFSFGYSLSLFGCCVLFVVMSLSYLKLLSFLAFLTVYNRYGIYRYRYRLSNDISSVGRPINESSLCLMFSPQLTV